MQTEEIVPQTHTVTSNTEQPSAPEITDAIKAPMYHITKYNSVLHVV